MSGKTITATFRIVTPMFLGDWEQGVGDGIRPPSIKGALRFWWRAINWKRALEQRDDKDKALVWLHREEARLFGTAAGNGGGGQGVFLISVNNFTKKQKAEFDIKKGYHLNKSGIEYLAGLGLFKPKTSKDSGGFIRGAIPAGSSFDVKIVFKKEQDIKTIMDSMVAFSLFGGLGSRARRGFGSVCIEKIDGYEEVYTTPQNKDELVEKIKSFAKADVKLLPPYSAFSSSSRVDISMSCNNAIDLLDKLGREMQLYRSYGRNQNGVYVVGNKTAEQNFKDDHDCMLEFAKNGQLERMPKRSVFGMPHNYFFSSYSKTSIEFASRLNVNDDSGRRASPLIIHIHRLPNDEYLAVQTLLEAEFLPEGAKVYAKIENGHSSSIDAAVDYMDIHKYLNRFNDRVETLK